MRTISSLEIMVISDEDNGEAYYVLPSGFKGKKILVNESPVDLTIKHVNEEDLVDKLQQYTMVA